MLSYFSDIKNNYLYIKDSFFNENTKKSNLKIYYKETTVNGTMKVCINECDKKLYRRIKYLLDGILTKLDDSDFIIFINCVVAPNQQNFQFYIDFHCQNTDFSGLIVKEKIKSGTKIKRGQNRTVTLGVKKNQNITEKIYDYFSGINRRELFLYVNSAALETWPLYAHHLDINCLKHANELFSVNIQNLMNSNFLDCNNVMISGVDYFIGENCFYTIVHRSMITTNIVYDIEEVNSDNIINSMVESGIIPNPRFLTEM